MKQPQKHFPATQPKAFFRTTIYAVLVLAILFFAYNAIRAWFVAITHDEAFTFNEYVRADLWEIVRVAGSNSNNHVLNTLVIKVFYNLLGSHLFVLRLYVVLLYGVYLLYGYKLLQHLKNPVLLICGFILLSANPFLFDFFSLARGYLPALACTLASLYYGIEYIKRNSAKTLWKCLVIAALAVLFHLSFLNYFVPLCGLLLLYMLRPENALSLQWKNLYRKGWVVIFVLLLVVSYALPVSLWIKSLGEMELAGKTGFRIDTVETLLYFSFYGQPYTISDQVLQVSSGVVMILLIFCTVLLVKYLRQGSFYQPFVFVSLLLLMMFLCIEAQHLILGNPFPNGRLALYFIPLFVLLVIYGLDKFNPFQISTVIGLIITIIAGAHFIYSFNLTKTYNWVTDADTPEMLTVLYDLEKQIKVIDPVRLGTYWADEPNINYYRIHNNYSWLRVMSREGFLPNDEYVYATPQTFRLFNREMLRVVNVFPVTGNILARNIYADSLQQIAGKTAELPDRHIIMDTMMSGGIVQFKRDEINADSILVEAQAWILVKSEYVGGGLIIAADGMNGNKNIWRSLKISDGIMRVGEWQQVCYSTIISLKDEPNAQINCYIWNTGKIPLHVAHVQVKIYDLKGMKPLLLNE